MFNGNKDSDSIVYHQLNPPIIARYIRLRPTAWTNHISLRVELYGCLGNYFFLNIFTTCTMSRIYIVIFKYNERSILKSFPVPFSFHFVYRMCSTSWNREPPYQRCSNYSLLTMGWKSCRYPGKVKLSGNWKETRRMVIS